jgi:CitMHS family citrate-Mg2+:H+ or citrate-Ca2+:H+ symporter
LIGAIAIVALLATIISNRVAPLTALIAAVIAGMAQHFGIRAEQVAQPALLGQMTTGFPVSPLTPATFLLAGLCKVELGAHQRFAIPWLFGTTAIMTAAAVLLGVFRI